jgi:uncharacterized protein
MAKRTPKKIEKLPLRSFGKRSGLRVRSVSIGAMRFPGDLDDAITLVRHAIDSGMRYIDTCRAYGESEWVLGQALKGVYRKKVILSTKWSPWNITYRPDDLPSADCVRRRLDESMKRLDVDVLDFYQIWSILSRDHYEAATRKGGMLEGILKAKKEGLVKHIGFTTHDSVENLLEYLEEADWCEVLLITYNILNRTYEPVIEAARAKGIGTIVMNPVGGGRFAEASPVFMRLAKKVGASSVPELAVRYVLSNPDVDTILCGMAKLSDIDDTLASAALPAFTPEQVDTINQFIAKRTPENAGLCTACNYCLPCPQGINIPAVMGAIYTARTLGFKENARKSYARVSPDAAACNACGQCAKKCTQQIDIPKQMAYAHRNLKKKKGK